MITQNANNLDWVKEQNKDLFYRACIKFIKEQVIDPDVRKLNNFNKTRFITKTRKFSIHPMSYILCKIQQEGTEQVKYKICVPKNLRQMIL